ncbi:MAG TPA: AsmA-like C-terminal domain-containing protein [Thermodesulfovibrionales bacterium]|nr:AsmA-like C-terminal domain-containing protein [Thermodesulfovibrionales bacterium]
MTRPRRRLRLIAGVAGVLLALMLVASLLAPHFIDSESVRQKIKAAVSKKVPGTVDFQKIEVSLFPRPTVTISKAKLSLPGKAEGTIGSLRIYPQIIPLFSGKVRLSSILIEDAVVSLRLPERKKEKTPFSIAGLEGDLSELMKTLSSAAPRLHIVVEGGMLNLFDEKMPLFSFTDIHGESAFPPGESSLTLVGVSNIAKGISLGFRLDPGTFQGTGTFHLTGFRPETLIDYLFPDAHLRLGESEANLNLSVQMRGFKDVRAEVRNSLPLLTVIKRGEKIAMKGISTQALLVFKDGSTELTLDELRIEDPQLDLQGKLLANESPGTVSLEVGGTIKDVPALRRTALPLAGEVPAVQGVFSYVRGGTIPMITFRSEARAFGDLGGTENTVLKGRLEDGDIFIPGPQLSLRAVSGDCIIVKGVLEGTNLEGHFGHSFLNKGKLRVGLRGEDAPLHLETLVQADVTDVFSVLKKVVKDEAFLDEINRVDALHGRATGRLVLGESVASINPYADVSDISLVASYQRFPFPLEIKGGRFLYDGERIRVKNLSGKGGRSSFSALTGQLGLGDTHYAEVLSGKADIVLDEIYPWLRSFEGFKGSLEEITSLYGMVTLNALNLRGPLKTPKEWRFATAGEIDNLSVESSLFPGSLLLRKGGFDADENVVSLRNAETEFLDASAVISGSQHGYLGSSQKTDLSLQGKLGFQAFGWVADRVGLPKEISPNSPLTLQEISVEWDRSGTAALKGNMRLDKGPEVSIDMVKSPEALVIHKLTLKDKVSDGSFGLDYNEKRVKFSFAGKMNGETLDSVIAGRKFGRGWIDGDFTTEIRREKPLKFAVQGRMTGGDLVFPWKEKLPLTIDRISLGADKGRITVESASLRLGDNVFSLSGDVKDTEKGALLDMDLFTDRINVDTIRELTRGGGGTRKSEEEQADIAENLAVAGTVRFRSNQFTYETFTWEPFQAVLSLGHNRVDALVTQASLCGISFPGTVGVSPKGLSLDFELLAENQDLGESVACFFVPRGVKERVTGRFDLHGHVTGEGDGRKLLESLKGDIEFNARDGIIYEDVRLVRVLAFLEPTEYLKGFRNYRKEGIAYHTIKSRYDLRDGKIEIKEAVLDGDYLKVAAEGTTDIINGKLDHTVLVSPIRTVNKFIEKIPLVGTILGGTLVTIPLKVTGDIEDPKVSYNPVSAVGSGLLGMMKRTLKAPVKLIEGLVPAEKKD